MDLEWLKSVAIIAGSLVALFTFGTAVLEYVRQGRQTRAQQFIQLHRRFRENHKFARLIDLLEGDDPQLAAEPLADRREFLAFFEELAIMVNSRLIRVELAHYVFGYYVGLCGRSRHLWAGLNREDTFWTLFNDFEVHLRGMTSSFRFERRMFRF